MAIEVKQHRGRTITGEEQGHDFDDVIWIDGDKRRRIAVVGHAKHSPIQWEVRDLPEAVKADARKEIEAAAKRRDDRNKERDRAATAANNGNGKRAERTD